MTKGKKTRIAISDLPADSTVSPEEMRKITGGFYMTGYRYVSIQFPQSRGQGRAPSSEDPSDAIPINIP